MKQDAMNLKENKKGNEKERGHRKGFGGRSEVMWLYYNHKKKNN